MRNLILLSAFAVTASLALPSTAEAQMEHTREGFWFTIGLGAGSLGCDGCTDRETGISGGLALGGTLTEKWQLGVATSGWMKEEAGATLSFGTLTALARFYPSVDGGFFLQGGLGLGSASVELAGYGSESEIGAGAQLGLGYDIRVGQNTSLTPFMNGVGVTVDDVSFNYWQLGLALTLH